MTVVVPSSAPSGGAGVLEIIQRAAPQIGLGVPTAVFGSSDAKSLELAAVVQEAAEAIVRAHDWTALLQEAQYYGDDASANFTLPDDYLRMARGGQVWSSSWHGPLPSIPTHDDYLNLDVRGIAVAPAAWIIIGGEMRFIPALGTGETARWHYISSHFVRDAARAPKPRFTADDDTFALDDRLLERFTIWYWRQRKGLMYSDDLRGAEMALAQQISDDRGTRIVTQRSRRSYGGKTSFPGTIVP